MNSVRQLPLDPEDSTKLVKVFVSYAHEDEALKDNFIDTLADDGMRAVAAFWDDRHLLPSLDWQYQLGMRIELSQIVFLLVTDNFLASSYCMDQELPLARAKAKNGTANVIAIVLRPLIHDAQRLGGLRRFPARGALSEASDVPVQIEGLRTHVRAWIVRTLSRNKEDYFFAVDVKGASAPSRVRGVVWALLCCAGGGLIGLASGVILPTSVRDVVTAIWALTVLTTCAAVFAVSLRGAEMIAFETIETSSLPSTRGLRFLRNTLPTALGAGTVNGVLFGLPLGAVLWLFGVTLPFGSVAAEVTGAALFLAHGWVICAETGDKQLQIVRDLGRSITTDQWPELGLFEGTVVDVATPEDRESHHETAPDEEDRARPPLKGEDDASLERSSTPVSTEPVLTETPTSFDEVSIRTVVIYCREYQADAEALRAALAATGVVDMLSLSFLTDEDLALQSADSCRRRLHRVDVCLPLVREVFLNSTVHAPLCEAVSQLDGSDTHLRVTPILIEPLSSYDSPLLRFQALPGEGLPIDEWPIARNAWRKVALSLADRHRSKFVVRLQRYWQKRSVDEMQSKAGVADIQALRRAYEEVGDHPLQLEYPYATFTRAAHVGAIARWAITSSLTMAPFLSATSIANDTARWLLATVACTGPLAGLAAKRALRVIKYSCIHFETTDTGLVDVIVRGDLPYVYKSGRGLAWLRSYVLTSALCAATGSCALIAAVYGISQTVEQARAFAQRHRTVYGVLLGAGAGAVAYLASSRKTPLVWTPQGVPSHRSVAMFVRDRAWRVQVPRDDHSRRDAGTLGSLEPHQRDLIRGRSLVMRASLSDVLPAARDAVVVCAVGFAVVVALSAAHINPGVAVLMGFASMGLTTRWQISRPPRHFRIAGRSFAWFIINSWFISPIVKGCSVFTMMTAGIAVMRPRSTAVASTLDVGIWLSALYFTTLAWKWLQRTQRSLRFEGSDDDG